jgi:4,5-DOPA dioxygenase extradiol
MAGVRSVFEPEIPGGAYDDFLTEAAPAASARSIWTPADGTLPALFLSHGAPPLLDDAAWMRELFGWAQRIPQPRAILIVSAHWEAAPLAISSSAANVTPVYDFGGFAPRYYAMRYDTPDASWLADRVRAVFADTTPVHQHSGRGLDHGAWVPLKVMYPNADVPTLQLSLPSSDPAQLLELGRRLRTLREEGVLVVGSGFMTHGLPFLTRDMFTAGAVPAWSADFAAWAGEALARGDVDELARWHSSAPGMPYAHPTDEHFVPLFVMLGAGEDPERPAEQTVSGYWAGLAKWSYQLA